MGTVQVDYNLPERFELEYIGADNAAHRPVMIHRAPFGSLERFIGILIEHFAGAFPLWLAPVQVAVLPVSDKFNDYAGKVAAAAQGRAASACELDDSPEKIGAKIRQRHDGQGAVHGRRRAARGREPARWPSATAPRATAAPSRAGRVPGRAAARQIDIQG